MANAEQIINFVKEHSLLFVYSHPLYKDTRAKDKKWKELGEQLDKDTETLKRQWKNLKDSYSRYLKAQKTTTGQAASKYQHWQWAKQIEFLKPHLAFADTITNVGSCSSQSQSILHEHEQQSCSEDQERNSPTEPDFHIPKDTSATYGHAEVSATVTAPHNVDGAKKRPTENLRRKSPAIVTQLSEQKRRKLVSPTSNVEKVMGFLEKRHEMDSVNHLFLSWAHTTKPFSPRRLLDTKMKISNIMLQQEQAQLDEDFNDPFSTHSSVLSIHTSQSTSMSPANKCHYVSPSCTGFDNLSLEGTETATVIDNFSPQGPQATPVEPGEYGSEGGGISSFFHYFSKIHKESDKSSFL